jgi:hypothetical protein
VPLRNFRDFRNGYPDIGSVEAKGTPNMSPAPDSSSLWDSVTQT